MFVVVKISKAVKKGSFSKNTAKRVAFTENWNTLFRVLSSILCSSIGTQLGTKHPGRYACTRGQGHSLTLVQGRSDSTLSNFFSLETAAVKFHVAPPWDGGMKVSSNGFYHMTKMATMPIYGKTVNHLFLWNQKADDLETWYAALATRVIPSLFK